MFSQFFRLKTILLVLFLFSHSTIFASSALIESEKKAVSIPKLIDVAGQQRMLTHKVLVAYAQIGQVQSFGNPVDAKSRSIAQFEKNLTILKQHDDIQLLLDHVQPVWDEFKVISLKLPVKEKMPELIRLNEQLLGLSNKIIAALVKNNNNNINIINQAGQQRMLSQRIALFMLVENWGFDGKYVDKFQDSLRQFSINHVALKKNEDNTDKISKKLQSVENDYKELVNVLKNISKDRDFSFLISRLTSQMLRKSKSNTKLYVELKKQNGV